jgi:hypothetical protein
MHFPINRGALPAPQLNIIRAANVWADRPRHVHRYQAVLNGIGDVMGRRCPCGLYQSGPDPAQGRYAGFTYDDY